MTPFYLLLWAQGSWVVLNLEPVISKLLLRLGWLFVKQYPEMDKNRHQSFFKLHSLKNILLRYQRSLY